MVPRKHTLVATTKRGDRWPWGARGRRVGSPERRTGCLGHPCAPRGPGSFPKGGETSGSESLLWAVNQRPSAPADGWAAGCPGQALLLYHCP